MNKMTVALIQLLNGQLVKSNFMLALGNWTGLLKRARARERDSTIGPSTLWATKLICMHLQVDSMTSFFGIKACS